MTFVFNLINLSQNDVVLTDDNDIPALVDNLTEFYDDISDVYSTASNTYYTKYEELKKNRSPEKLINND